MFPPDDELYPKPPYVRTIEELIDQRIDMALKKLNEENAVGDPDLRRARTPPMTNNLIEKVARAIFEAYEDNMIVPREWDGSPEDRARSRIMATAAVAAVYEALREPSDEMFEAGHETLYEGTYDATMNFALAPTWQAMLSASPIVQEE